MASNIDPNKPTSGQAKTADVRANFAAAKAEIEALQTGKQDLDALLSAIAALNTATDKLMYFIGADQVALADLTPAARALLALTGAADRLPYFTGASTAALAALTAFARSLLDDPDASTALSTLGVSDYAKTLLDDPDAATARATLGVIGASDSITFTGANYYHPHVAVTANATIGSSHVGKIVACDTSSAAITLTLDSSGVTAGGAFWVVHAAGNNSVTLSSSSANILVDAAVSGVSSYTLNIRSRAFVYWGGSAWIVVPSQPRVLGNPTGGDKGAGTLNAVALYDNGKRVVTRYAEANITTATNTIEFTGLTNATEIDFSVAYNGLSGNTSFPGWQLGNSSGYPTNNYAGASSYITNVVETGGSQNYALIYAGSSGISFSGSLKARRSASGYWTLDFVVGRTGGSQTAIGGYRCSISGVDRIRFGGLGNGTDTFTGGFSVAWRE